MKKLKILLAALLVIGSTAKAQVVYGENEKEYIKASSFSNGRTEKKDSKPFLSGQEKYKLSSIGSNWFGSIKAGMSTFSGAYQIVDMLVDTCSTKRKMLRIAGDDKPTEVVRSRLKKLNADHIRIGRAHV